MRSSADADRTRPFVTDQPSLLIITVGVIISVIVGMTFRAVFSPLRVKDALDRAIADSRPGMSVAFGAAELSLANGPWPRLSILVHDLKVEATDPCLLQPQLAVDEVEIPIPFSSLWTGQIHGMRLFASSASLRLKEAPADGCSPEPNSPEANGRANESSRTSSSTVPAPPVDPYIAAQAGFTLTIPSIQSLRIEALSVRYDRWPDLDFRFSDLNVLLESLEPRIIALQGQLLPPKDVLMTDFVSPGQLSARMAPDKIVAQLQGHWREGHYNFEAKYNPRNTIVEFDAQVKHLPISLILRLLHRYGMVRTAFRNQNLWGSMQASFVEKLESAKKWPLTFSHVKIEGDLGVISVPSMKLNSVAPLSFEPFEVSLTDLDLDQLLDFAAQKRPSPTLAELGRLNGTLVFQSPEESEFQGEIQGMEFIFANRGLRQNQVIDSLHATLHVSKGAVEGVLQDFQLRNGVFDGEVRLGQSPEDHELQVVTKFKQLALDPDVQRIMTGGGHLGPLMGQMEGRFRNNQMVSVIGSVKADSLVVDAIEFSKVLLMVRTEKERFIVEPKVQNITVQNNSPAYGFLTPILESNKGESLAELRNVFARFEMGPQKAVRWSGFQAQSKSGKVRLFSEGHWDEGEQLMGQVTLKRAKEDALVWSLNGTRERPLLERAKIDEARSQ